MRRVFHPDEVPMFAGAPQRILWPREPTTCVHAQENSWQLGWILQVPAEQAGMDGSSRTWERLARDRLTGVPGGDTSPPSR